MTSIQLWWRLARLDGRAAATIGSQAKVTVSSPFAGTLPQGPGPEAGRSGLDTGEAGGARSTLFLFFGLRQQPGEHAPPARAFPFSFLVKLARLRTLDTAGGQQLQPAAARCG